MSNFGHVVRVTKSVGNREFTFRSLLEYRYAEYLELLRETGEIQEWDYENQDYLVEFAHGRLTNVKQYLPDFVVYESDEVTKVVELKGFFPSIDYTKIRRFVDGDAYFVSEKMKFSYTEDFPFTLVFAAMPGKSKGQLLRAQKLEKYFNGTENRIIWNAGRDIFKKISWRFDEQNRPY